MESAATMVELGGGEWSSFNGVSINDEADFMAQLFPNNNNSSLTNQLENSCGFLLGLSSSSSGWTDQDQSSTGMAGYDTNSSFYTSDDTTDSNNMYSNFSQGSSSYSGSIANYQCSENYYLSDHHHQFLTANNVNSSLPVDFCLSGANYANLEPEFPDTNLQLKPEYGTSEIEPAVAEDKACSDLSETARKRSRVSDHKGKRNVRSKKNQRVGSDDEDNDAAVAALNNTQNSSSSSSEDDSNGSQESDPKGTAAVNLNGKSRASRGSATDPQSLYARKRRERINERLRILQSLVPNGTKVDISTMLEEAVHYVKFLQLQIKLLSSDDLWMYAPLAYNGMDIGRLEALDLKIKKAEMS